jgi:hypothetical protein
MSFQQKWTDPQREAVINAILERGMTARAAVTAGAAGELGLPPFSMPLGTAHHIAGKAKQDRNPEQIHATKAENYRRRLEEIFDQAISRLETQKDPPMGQIREAARTVREFKAMTSSPRPETKPKTNGNAPEPPADRPDLLDRLAAEEGKREPEQDALHDALPNPEEKGAERGDALQPPLNGAPARSSRAAAAR